jgi:hypothetical protein
VPVELLQQRLYRCRGDRRLLFDLALFPTLDGLFCGRRSYSTLRAIGQVVALLISDRSLDFFDDGVARIARLSQ